MHPGVANCSNGGAEGSTARLQLSHGGLEASMVDTQELQCFRYQVYLTLGVWVYHTRIQVVNFTISAAISSGLDPTEKVSPSRSKKTSGEVGTLCGMITAVGRKIPISE